MNWNRTAPFVAASALLAGCNAFVPPQVLCGEIVVTSDLQLKSARPGMACAFPDALAVTVMRAPKVDPDWAAENGEVGSLSLVGAPVEVTAGGAGVMLCPGPVCDPTASQIVTNIDSYGALSYRVLVNLEMLAGALPGPGGTSVAKGTIAMETYRPGNACTVNLELNMGCAEATETQ